MIIRLILRLYIKTDWRCTYDLPGVLGIFLISSAMATLWMTEEKWLRIEKDRQKEQRKRERRKMASINTVEYKSQGTKRTKQWPHMNPQRDYYIIIACDLNHWIA